MSVRRTILTVAGSADTIAHLKETAPFPASEPGVVRLAELRQTGAEGSKGLMLSHGFHNDNGVTTGSSGSGSKRPRESNEHIAEFVYYDGNNKK